MKRPLGHSASDHASLGAKRRASAKRLYKQANAYAKRGLCSGAITNLTLASSYEGEAHAHAEAASTNEMLKVRKLMTIRDKTLDIVIKACKR